MYSYVIKWRLFNDCNFKCSYCINTGLPETFEDMESKKARLMRTASQIDGLVRNTPEIAGRNIRMLLIGGEITILPVETVIKIMDRLAFPNLVRLCITTNFTASLEWYGKLRDYCSGRNIQLGIVASLHEEFFDVEKFKLKAVAATEMFNGEHSRFRCELVITKENKKMADEVLKYFDDHNVRYIVDYNRFEEWTQEEKTHPTTANDSDRWLKCASEDTHGYLCSFSENQLVVRETGMLYGCGNTKITPIGRLGLTDRIPLERKSCPLHKCSCCGNIEVRRQDGSIYYTSVV